MGKRNSREAAGSCTRFFVCEARERERDARAHTHTQRKRKMQAIGGRRANFVRGGVVGSVRTSPNQGRVARGGRLSCNASLKDIRDRIGSVKNTQKITDAMKLVAAAKVRRAQDAVISGRPFSSKLVDMLYGVNTRLRSESEVDSPLLDVKPVEKVLVVAFTGDRGLCGGFNNFILKRTEQRVAELKATGVEAELILVGKKGGQYFGRRSDQYEVVRSFETGQKPTVKESQAIADVIYSKFVGGEVQNDELFLLTTKEGELAVERETTNIADGEGFDELLIFEQEPQQILDALLPLYMNGTVLRALQESLASELAAMMNAMNSASDNAKELKKNLTLQYNRGRQAKITGEIIEICAGASAAS